MPAVRRQDQRKASKSASFEVSGKRTIKSFFSENKNTAPTTHSAFSTHTLDVSSESTFNDDTNVNQVPSGSIEPDSLFTPLASSTSTSQSPSVPSNKSPNSKSGIHRNTHVIDLIDKENESIDVGASIAIETRTINTSWFKKLHGMRGALKGTMLQAQEGGSMARVKRLVTFQPQLLFSNLPSLAIDLEEMMLQLQMEASSILNQLPP
jgi:hypothetical protein